jgi:hypothetical protein
MAEAFPNSSFWGFDYHEGSIETARKLTKEAGLSDRVSFDVHSAKTYPANGYDLICFFDCLHDMGDPVGALKHVRETMAADGTCMLVEPFAHDRLEDNFNPVGRMYFAASTMICTPRPRSIRKSASGSARRPAKGACARLPSKAA